jgi:hypothetical protein
MVSERVNVRTKWPEFRLVSRFRMNERVSLQRASDAKSADDIFQ